MINNSLYMVRLKDIQKNSTNCDGILASYFLSHILELSTYTLFAVSEKTNISYATICRFFKKLGINGFKEFKKIMAEELKKNGSDKKELLDFDIENLSSVSYDQISKSVYEFSSSVMSNYVSLLKGQTIEKIVKAFQKAETICFVGLGTSAVSAQYACTKFFRLKLSCSFDSDMIISKMKSSLLKENDILFAISSSGRTKPIVEMAKIAKSNGVKVISICDFVNSPLTHLSDISICTTVRESNKYLDMDFPLIQGQITLIDILYACIYNASKDSFSQSFNKTKSSVEEDKLK